MAAAGASASECGPLSRLMTSVGGDTTALWSHGGWSKWQPCRPICAGAAERSRPLACHIRRRRTCRWYGGRD